jgi:hypothetical protein
MIDAIRELQEADVEPDLWKVEGLVSAPLNELQRKFGFEPEHVVTAAMELPRRD